MVVSKPVSRRHFSFGAFASAAGATLVALKTAAAQDAATGAAAKAADQSVQHIDSNEISADLITPDVKRVGMRLRCLCGCAMTVGECNMVGCHFASPSREKIRAMQKAGMSDDMIVADFVKREGIKILAAPPATGFNWFGYSAPYIVGGLGAVVVGFVVKHMMQPPPAPAATGPSSTASTPISAADMDRYSKAAARDIEEMED